MNERIRFSDLPAGLIAAMMAGERHLATCGLAPGLLELVRLRASQVNGCAYCIDMHFKEGLHVGESGQRLTGLGAWRDAPYYSARERAALAWTDQLTHLADGAPADADWAAARAHFSAEELANLSFAAAQINSWHRLVKAFAFTAGNYVAGG